MLEKILKFIKYNNMPKKQQDEKYKLNIKPEQGGAISFDVKANLKNLQNVFGNSEDVIFRSFKMGDVKHTEAILCYIEGMEDKSLLNEYVIKALMVNPALKSTTGETADNNLVESVKENLLVASRVYVVSNMKEVLEGILAGASALFLQGCNTVIIISATDIKTREVEEPSTEALIRGPREGFVESVRINTSLLRRKIKNPNLIFERMKLGEQTQTKIVIAYIKGIADDKIVDEVKRRLSQIQTDSILESGYIEQFIDDHPLSPFTTIGNSERPDKVAGKLLEGRVAILCDGTPFVLTLPYLFVENLQVGEDYYSYTFGATLIRIIRTFALFASLLTAPLYIAVLTYQPEMIPTILLITSAASKEGTPFPTIIETVLMLTVFETLRESGLRLPRQLGQALSIVGVLVIGDAAVRAGIISSPMVIISAFTGITSFIIQPLFDSVIIFRALLILLAGIFGFYGIVLGLIVILAHVCSLTSFGVPYFAPFAPLIWRDLKDSIIKVPVWKMDLRPKSINAQNQRRQTAGIRQKMKDNKDGEEN